ncbi:hypothetical protein CDAR_215771 [Caerostris darwini]|uniref:Uncharacterized protein n=1 Tax=Caerostris darwini TaxID=1538125 RepID=A0AAV4M6D2_9ARAC|nr:hypothetical protein CDAR_215771 [Caerostris darwini]
MTDWNRLGEVFARLLLMVLPAVLGHRIALKLLPGQPTSKGSKRFRKKTSPIRIIIVCSASLTYPRILPPPVLPLRPSAPSGDGIKAIGRSPEHKVLQKFLFVLFLSFGTFFGKGFWYRREVIYRVTGDRYDRLESFGGSFRPLFINGPSSRPWAQNCIETSSGLSCFISHH